MNNRDLFRRPLQPWETEYSNYTDDELAELWRAADEAGDWALMDKLAVAGRTVGKPPAGFGYVEQADFRDRRR